MKKIKYLGPEGSYSEIAAQQFLDSLEKSGYTLDPILSIKEIAGNIDSGQGDFGILPIENSIEGTVRESIDALIHSTSRVYVIQEIVIPIEHCLATLANNFHEIKVLITHPQALAQCSNFIQQNLPHHIEKIITQSTSSAMKAVAEYKNHEYAAIGHEKGAYKYNLPILQRKINNVEENKTRFFVIGNDVSTSQEKCKSSIAFSTVNKAGALVNILNIFAKNNINLLHIESRPSKKLLGDYLFFIEFEGHKEDKNVTKALEKCVHDINFYKFLGSYTLITPNTPK